MSAVRELKPLLEKELFPVQEQGKPLGETGLHVQQILDITGDLQNYFQAALVVVLADHTFYYERDNPKKYVVPDVFVVKNVAKMPWRRVFKLWEEAIPAVVFEISSRKTWGVDLNIKWELYQRLGIKEYYIFDPEYDYLPEPIVAYRLNNFGELKKVAVKKGRIFSPELGLELVDTGNGLRFFDPRTKKMLPRTGELIETNNDLIVTNIELTETNNELIGANTELIETNTELTAKITGVVDENEKLKAELARLQEILRENK